MAPLVAHSLCERLGRLTMQVSPHRPCAPRDETAGDTGADGGRSRGQRYPIHTQPVQATRGSGPPDSGFCVFEVAPVLVDSSQTSGLRLGQDGQSWSIDGFSFGHE